jgi:branched-chain amino acid transport system permease protein
MASLLPHVVNGASLGLLFALIALGFMLVVSLMETINLAHGSFFVLGMYIALTIVAPSSTTWLPVAGWNELSLGWRYGIALILAPLAVGAAGVVLELALRRTFGKDPLYGLLFTFGAALVIEEIIRALWGSTEKQLPLPAAITGAFMVGDLAWSTYRLFACGFAALAIGALWLFLEKTPYGAIIKAGAHDAEIVRALVSTCAIVDGGVQVGVALAGLAGVVMAPIWGMRPAVGVDASSWPS